jgi:hypothetical protein
MPRAVVPSGRCIVSATRESTLLHFMDATQKWWSKFVQWYLRSLQKAMRESYIVDLTSDGSTIAARTCDRKSRPTMSDAVSVDAARRGAIWPMQTSSHTSPPDLRRGVCKEHHRFPLPRGRGALANLRKGGVYGMSLQDDYKMSYSFLFLLVALAYLS